MTVAEPLPAWFPFTAIRHEEAHCPLHLIMKTINEWHPLGVWRRISAKESVSLFRNAGLRHAFAPWLRFVIGD